MYNVRIARSIIALVVAVMRILMCILISKRINSRRCELRSRFPYSGNFAGIFCKPDHGSDRYPNVVRHDAEGFITHS